jgi:hypothetical protein
LNRDEQNINEDIAVEVTHVRISGVNMIDIPTLRAPNGNPALSTGLIRSIPQKALTGHHVQLNHPVLVLDLGANLAGISVDTDSGNKFIFFLAWGPHESQIFGTIGMVLALGYRGDLADRGDARVAAYHGDGVGRLVVGDHEVAGAVLVAAKAEVLVADLGVATVNREQFSI